MLNLVSWNKEYDEIYVGLSNKTTSIYKSDGVTEELITSFCLIHVIRQKCISFFWMFIFFEKKLNSEIQKCFSYMLNSEL